MSTAIFRSEEGSIRFSNVVNISCTLVGRSADRVAIDVGWRQGDTIRGLRELEDQRRGMASKKYMPRLEMEDGE
jgi:hypothetical protein